MSHLARRSEARSAGFVELPEVYLKSLPIRSSVSGVALTPSDMRPRLTCRTRDGSRPQVVPVRFTMNQTGQSIGRITIH